jgi:hypothetical protein
MLTDPDMKRALGVARKKSIISGQRWTVSDLLLAAALEALRREGVNLEVRP